MERSGCSNKNECPLRNTRKGCFVDIHHIIWPASAYKRGIAREYRELDEHKVQLCRQEHNEIHATQEPPLMPSLQAMHEAVLRSRGGNHESAA